VGFLRFVWHTNLQFTCISVLAVWAGHFLTTQKIGRNEKYLLNVMTGWLVGAVEHHGRAAMPGKLAALTVYTRVDSCALNHQVLGVAAPQVDLVVGAKHELSEGLTQVQHLQ
jgi:hypothetical protein